MNKLSFFVASAAIALMGAHVDAGYQAIGIYNTGVSSNGTPLAGGVQDTHYAVSTTVETSQTAYAIGTPDPAWVPNDATSRWINPLGTASSENNGLFVYTTSFDLNGLDATTASLFGRIAADDKVTVLLNGSSAGIEISKNSTHYGNSTPDLAYTTFYNLSITGGFKAGVNTLTFNEENLHGGPAGLRVEIAGTANAAVPEPASLGLMGLGLASVGFVARRRRRIS